MEINTINVFNIDNICSDVTLYNSIKEKIKCQFHDDYSTRKNEVSIEIKR